MSANDFVKTVVYSTLVSTVFFAGVASHDSITTAWGAGAIVSGAAKTLKRHLSELYEEAQSEIQSPSPNQDLGQAQEAQQLVHSFDAVKEQLAKVTPVVVPVVMSVAGIATANPAALFAGTARLSDHYLSRRILSERETTERSFSGLSPDPIEGREELIKPDSALIYTQLQLQSTTAPSGAVPLSSSIADYLRQEGIDAPDSRIATDIAIAGTCEERGLDAYAVLQHSPRFQNLTSPQGYEYLDKVVFVAQTLLQESRCQTAAEVER